MMKIPRQYKDQEILYKRIIVFTAVIIVIAVYFGKILNAIAWVLGICMPFLFGGGLAFVFNLISKGLLRGANYLFKMKETTLTRVIANILSIVIVFGVILCFALIIFPQLFTSFETIVTNLPAALNGLYYWAYNVTKSIPMVHEWVLKINPESFNFANLSRLAENIVSMLFSGGANNVFGSVYQFLSATFSYVFSTFVAIMFSIIVLFNKKTVVHESKEFIRAYLPDDLYIRAMHVCRLINKTFSAYIGGTCVECIILGTLVTVFASIFKLPYALLSGVICAIGALVPMFGAITAACIAALFIATTSIEQAIYFMIMFICIQQVEGNFIYPNVVGRAVSFPPIYVVIAVTLGASVAGVVGMIIFIPICSCIYQLIKEDVILRNKGKKRELEEV